MGLRQYLGVLHRFNAGWPVKAQLFSNIHLGAIRFDFRFGPEYFCSVNLTNKICISILSVSLCFSVFVNHSFIVLEPTTILQSMKQYVFN